MPVLTVEQLQKQLNPQTGIPYTQDEAYNIIQSKLLGYKDPTTFSPSLQPSSIVSTKEDMFGGTELNSYLDRGITPTPGVDIQELRAQEQSWGDQVFNGLVKASSTAVTSGLESLVSIPVGLYEYATTDKGLTESMYTNPIGVAFDNWNESLREALPNYYSEKETSLMQDLATTNFWFDKFANGAGYMAGAFAAGYGVSKLFQFSKLAQAGKLNQLNVADEMATINNLSQASKNVKLASAAEQLAVSSIMSHGESSVEARGIYNNVKENLLAQGLSEEEAEAEAVAAGNVGYGLNMAIVGLTNYAQFGKAIATNFKNSTKALNELNQEVVEGSIKTTAKQPGKMLSKDFLTSKGFDRAKRFGEGVLEEGAQEGGQFVTEKGLTEYYERKYDTIAGNEFASIADALSYGMEEAFGSKEGLESMLLGALLGGPSQVALNRGQFDDKAKRTEQVASLLNSSPLKKRIDAMKTIISLDKDILAATESGDEFVFKNLEYDQFKTWVKDIVDNGGYEVLTEKLDMAKDLSEDEFKKMFGFNQSQPLPDTKENIVNKVKDRAARINNKIENIKLRHGHQPQAVQDALFDAVTNFDNIDQRELELSNQINSLSNGAVNYDAVRGSKRDNAEYKETFNTTLREWEKTANPDKINEVKAIVKDLNKLANRREKYINQYNQALKDPNSFSLKDRIAKDLETEELLYQQSENDYLVDLYKSNTDENEEFGFDSTEFEIEVPESKVEATEITYTDKDGNEQTVLAVTPLTEKTNKDVTWINFTDSEGKKRGIMKDKVLAENPTETSGKKTIKVKYKKGDTNNVYDEAGNAYSIREYFEQILDNPSIKTVKAQRQELIKEAQVRALTTLMIANEETLNTVTEELMESQKQLDAAIELLTKVKSKIKAKTVPGKKVVNTILKLETEVNRLTESVNKLKAQRDSLLEENGLLEGELASISETGTAYDLRPYKNEIEDAIMRTEALIAKTEEKIGGLQRLISRLKGIVKGFYTSYKNLLEKKYGNITIFNYDEIDLDPELTTLSENEQRVADKVFINQEALAELEDVLAKNKEYLKYLQDQLDYVNKVNAEFQPILEKLIKEKNTTETDTTSKANNQEIGPNEDKSKEFDGLSQKPSIINPGFHKTVGQHYDAQGNETAIDSKRRWFRALPNLPLGDGTFSIKFILPNTAKELYTPDEILLHRDSAEEANIKVILYRNGKPVNSKGEAIDEVNITSEGLYINVGLSELATADFGFKFHDASKLTAEEVAPIVEEYNSFRNEVFTRLKNGEPVFSPVTGKGNGVVNTTKDYISVEAALTQGTPLNKVEIIIPSSKDKKIIDYPISPTQSIKLVTGMPYMKTPEGNVIPLNNRQLTEQEVDTTFNLLSLLGKGLNRVYKNEEAKKADTTSTTKKPKKVFVESKSKRATYQKRGRHKGKRGFWVLPKSTEETPVKGSLFDLLGVTPVTTESIRIKDYLESLIFMGKNNPNPATRIYIEKNILHFGESKVALKDVKKKENEIRTFLQNKYIQISNTNLQESVNKPDIKYTEILEVDFDGIAVTQEHPNYKHFLLSSDGRAVEEIPLTTNLVAKDSNEPQFKSQYAIFSPQINNAPTNPVVTVQQEVAEVFNTTETLPAVELPAIQLGEAQSQATPQNTSLTSVFGLSFNSTPVTEQAVTEATGLAQLPVQAEGSAADFGVNIPLEEGFVEEGNDAPYKIAKFKVSEEDRINTQEAKKWIENKLGLPVEVTDRLINNKAFGQFANNVIKLSKLGYKGVEYHEALHGVMRAFLTPSEYKLIIKEAAEKYPAPSKQEIQELGNLYPKLNVTELVEVYYEEKIADAFEDYVLSKGKITPPGFKTKSFFEKLWDVIKRMLKLGTTDIQDLFERIESGYYKGKAVRLNNTSSIYSALPQMSEEETKIILDGLTVEFMTSLFRDNNSVEDLINLEPSKIINYYNRAKEALYNRLTATPDNAVKQKIQSYLEVGSNWDNLIKTHIEFLQQFGFELSGQFNIDEDGNIGIDEVNSGRETSYDNNAINVSVKDTTSSFVKLLIGTLPKRVIKNGKLGFVTNPETGFFQLEDAGNVFNFLLNNLAGINDYNKMIEVLTKKSSIYPTIKGLIGRLELKTNTPDRQFRLQKQFQQSFSKAKFNYDLWLIGSSGTIYPINPNSNKLENKLKDNWKSNIKNMALSKSPFFKRNAATGAIQANVVEIKKALDRVDARKDFTPWSKAVAFLNAMGFPLSNPELIPSDVITEFLNTDYPFIVSAFLNPDYTIDNIFGSEESTRFNKLISLEANYQSDTVELMHIGPDGKTRYGVSLNNYFTTIANVLNEGLSLDELEVKYPQLFGFFNETSILLQKGGLLFDEKGKRNGRKFAITISEGIKPQESSDGQTYDELGFSDRVMLSFNSILDNKFPMIRTSDKTLEFQMEVDLGFKTDISSQKERVDNIVRGYLLSEALRVKAVNSDTYKDIQYFSKRGKEFIMFKFLPASIKTGLIGSPDSAVYIEQNKEAINAEIDKYFNSLKSRYIKTLTDNNMIIPYSGAYLNKGISENFIQEVEETYSKGYISQEGLNKLLDSFIAKSYISNIEQHMVFFGDPAFYKNAADFFKRTSGASGTKKFAFVDEHTNNYINTKERFDKKKTNRETIKSLVYEDVKVMSNYYDNIGKVIGKKAAQAYAEMVEADAQGLISIDEYREFMDRAGEWSSKHEALYQKIIGNIQLTDKEISFILQPLKLQYFGNQDYNNSDERIARLNVPTFYKFSVVPLIPQVIKETSLQKLADRMTEEQIGIVTFESGAKVGAKLQSTGKLLPFYDKKGQVVLPNKNVNYNYLPYQYLGIQLDINPKVKQKVTFGTQFRKLIKSNLFTKGVAKNPKALELATKYDTLVSKITDNRIEELLKEVGAVKTNEGWKVTNFNKFKDLLRKSAIERQAPANLVDSINSITDRDGLIRFKIDALPNRNKIENILLAIINNTAVKQKVNGGAKIQMASTGWERNARKFNKDGVLLSNELKFYRIENGKVLPMQIKLPLPAKMKPYALYLGDGNLEKGLEILNAKVKELINNPNVENGFDRRLLNIVGYRIPTQGLNSIENMEIEEFLHPSAGELIVLPTEIVAKSGGDFDVDKLSIFEPYFKTNIETDTEEFRKYLEGQSVSPVVLENIKSFSKEDLKTIIEDLNGYSLTTGRGVKGDLKDYFDSIGASKIQLDFYWEVKESLIAFNKIKNLLPKESSLIYIETGENEKAWLNDIIKVSAEILEMPENFEELITPNTTDNLLSLAKEIYNYERGNEKAEEDPDTLDGDVALHWDVIQRTAQSFLSGKKGVGIAALQRTHHVLAQTVNLSISPFIGKSPTQIYLEGMEGEYSLANEYDVKKQNKISDIISEFINGYVDVAKNPFVFTINAGLQSANTWLYLIRRGVPVKTAGYFMNQPIIKDYLKEQELNESITNKSNDNEKSKQAILQTVYTKYFSALAAAKNMAVPAPKDMMEEINKLPNTFFSASNLKKYILEGSSETKTAPIEYNQAQILILKDFLNYQGQAKLLGELVNVTKPDTTVPKNLAEAHLDKIMFKRVMEETPFINADKLITDTFLKSFKNVHDIESEVYNEFFVTENPQFKKYMDLIIMDKLFLSKEKLTEIMDKFKNGFIQYLISHANFKGKSIAGYFKELFIGNGTPVTTLPEAILNRSLPEVVKAIQTSNINFKNNPIFKELVVLLSNGDVTERSIYDNMKLFSRKMTKYESDVLTSGLRELAEKADSSASKQIFERLFLFSVIQSGIGNSPFSFYDKLPFDAVAPLVNTALTAYEASPGTTNLSEFFVQFYLNNLSNSSLVPKIKGSIIQNLGDSTYGHMSNESVPELSMSLPKVIRVPLEGPNSYLSRNPVLKTWVMSPDMETKKKQGKRIGLWIPYVMVKSEDGFNYYAAISPIGNTPYFSQYGKMETLYPLSKLPLPNADVTVTAWVTSKETKPTAEKEVKELPEIEKC